MKGKDETAGKAIVFSTILTIVFAVLAFITKSEADKSFGKMEEIYTVCFYILLGIAIGMLFLVFFSLYRKYKR